MRALDLLVCPGCGTHGIVPPVSDSWTCGVCGYEASERPPTLAEMMGKDSGDWDDVNLAAYARKVVALVLIGADQINPTAARTIGLSFLGVYPSTAKGLLPLMSELSKELSTPRERSKG